MCTIPPVTARNVEPSELAGVDCPICGPTAKVDFMRFLDPHGVERVDRQLFECTAKRHVFAIKDGALRLFSADGKRQTVRRDFALSAGTLVEQPLTNV